MSNIIHKELSFQIMSAAIEVHNVLGSGFLEKVYERALLHELKICGMEVEPQKELRVRYKGANVGYFIADIVVNNKILLELKAVEKLGSFHQAQVIHYLKATGLKLGILINFGTERVESKRLVL